MKPILQKYHQQVILIQKKKNKLANIQHEQESGGKGSSSDLKLDDG